MKTATATSRHRRGSAVLDAALVFPILLSLTFGCIEFGHFFYIKHTLQGAAREGARAGATSGASDANTLVTNAVTGSMTAAGIASNKYTTKVRNAADTADIVAGTQTAGTAILVKVECTWSVVGIRPLNLINGTKKVTGMTTMRKEG